MSNSRFRIQSFGSSSAFVPSIIDDARNLNPSSGGSSSSVSKTRSTGPVVTLAAPTVVCFYAIKFDNVNTTMVNTITAPIRNLSTGAHGSVLFYTQTGTADTSAFTAITGPANYFDVTDTQASELAIVFDPTTLPPATTANPIFLGIKLNNADLVVLNSQYTATGSNNGYCFSGQNATGPVLLSYPASAGTISYPSYLPELYVTLE